MRNWKCLKCKKYKPIDYKKIKVGDMIFFYKEKIKAKKIERSICIGEIISIKQDVVTIGVVDAVYQCALIDVYPMKAPAKIVYDIFGQCQC